jgi:VWFA-related protein
MKKFMTSCITILLLTNFAYTQAQTPMSAQEIIERMVEVYANCRTYSDVGEVSTERWRQPFLTAFVRPASFRFEFSRLRKEGFPRPRKEEWDRFIARKEGNVEEAWWASYSRSGPASLERTLLSMGFLSDGAALATPTLLLPNLFRGRSILTALDELRLAGDDKVDGRKTFKLEGKFHGKELKLWIDQSEFLILKIWRKVKFGSVEIETTTKYKPQVNGDISRDRLAFNPPSDSRATQGSSQKSGLSSPLPLSALASGRPDTDEPPRLKEFGSSLKANTKAKAVTKQKRSREDEDNIIRVDTDLVVCDVLVFDKQGKWIKGLSKNDFVIKEDDKLQEIGSFSLGDAKTIRRSIVLIIAYSGSQLPYIKTSIEAAKTLIDRLNPTDRVAIVTDDVELLVDFTSDKEILKAGLESLKTSALSGRLGRSEQYDSLMAALQELFGEEDLRPIIIFQTDGDQLNTLSVPLNPYILQKTFTIEEIMTAAEKARATIYSIIPGIRFIGLSEDEQLQKAKIDWQNRMESRAVLRRMQNLPEPKAGQTTVSDKIISQNAASWIRLQLALFGLAKYTGGWTDYLERPDQADEVYTRILNDINRRYVIGYYPTNRIRDGKRRKVTMEVRGHPEYVVWGRKTYFSPEPD